MKVNIPILKPREVVVILAKVGFIKKRQTGSHLILLHPQTRRIVPVPMHPKPLKKGLMLGIIKEAGLTLQEFINLIKK